MRNVSFEPEALEQLHEWNTSQWRFSVKILSLLMDCSKTPFEGIGKPEPLKNNLSGFWSRRINETDRVVYAVNDTTIYVISCRGHYNKDK